MLNGRLGTEPTQVSVGEMAHLSEGSVQQEDQFPKGSVAIYDKAPKRPWGQSPLSPQMSAGEKLKARNPTSPFQRGVQAGSPEVSVLAVSQSVRRA